MLHARSETGSVTGGLNVFFYLFTYLNPKSTRSEPSRSTIAASVWNGLPMYNFVSFFAQICYVGLVAVESGSGSTCSAATTKLFDFELHFP